MTDQKERYKVYTFALHQGTIDLLRRLKMESGKSWNRFMWDLLMSYAPRDAEKALDKPEIIKFKILH